MITITFWLLNNHTLHIQRTYTISRKIDAKGQKVSFQFFFVFFVFHLSPVYFFCFLFVCFFICLLAFAFINDRKLHEFAQYNIQIFHTNPCKTSEIIPKIKLWLTLRPRNTYIYGFRALFGFCNFCSHFLLVLKARGKFILFYTKCWVNRATFLASTCTSLLLRSKPVQRNYRHFFWDFKPKSGF